MSEVADRSGEFGELLRRDRLAAGLTQEELAERAEVSVRAISDLECGRTSQPRRSTVRRISAALSRAATGNAALVTAAAATAAAAQQPTLAQLPADLADFTGRREQLELLTGLLSGDSDGAAPGAVIVSAVAGAGGIGKTALAVHAAHQVAARFPDGQLYLNLRGSSCQPVTPAEALARFLRDLGADRALPADEGESAARYRSLLAGRRLLIMLDDARDAAQVRPLLPGTSGCVVVVTSRSSLADLESARLLDLDCLADADALALFTRVTGPARAVAEPEAVRQVLAACGGLPLAIRIAAARLAARPGWSVAALAARLSDACKRLDEFQAGDLAVRASFMVSYAQVRSSAGPASAAPDRAFRLLALADGPDISLPAAAALLGLPIDQAERSLELLIDAHLLQTVAPGRYRFHDLLRVYASELVMAEEDTAEREAAARQMLGWYVHTAAAAARLVHPHGYRLPLEPPHLSTAPLSFVAYADALAWLDAEYASLVAAVSQAARQGEHELTWKLSASLWGLFYLRGHVDDWIATHQTGLASTRVLGDRAAELWLLNNLGVAYLHARRPRDAIDCLRQSLPLVRDTDDTRGLAITQVNLGWALADTGRYDEAMQSLLQALGLFREIGNRHGEGIALAGIAGVCRRRGQFSDAISYYELALDASRDAGDLVGEGTTLVELSALRLTLGQIDGAVGEAMAAVELYRQTGNTYGQARAMVVLGSVERDRGHPERARQHWYDAAAIFTVLGLPQASDVAADLSGLESR